MATSHTANQLNNLLRTLRLAACRRLLAKGRAMQVSGNWVSAGGDDIFDCWRHSLGANDPLPNSFDIDLCYLDTVAAGDGASYGTVLMTHGIPGSHNDFKYLIPLCIDKNIRVLAPNFPGYGRTESPPHYRQSNDERAELLLDVLHALGLTKIDVIVGHSAGCYPLLKLGADEEYITSNGPVCRAFVFVNPGGIQTPHKAVRPLWLARLTSKLQYTRLRWLVGWLEYVFWRYVLGFRIPSPEPAMAGTDMVANIGWSQLPSYLRRLSVDPSLPRVLIMYAEDDQYVEKESSEKTVASLGIDFNSIFHVSSKDDIEAVLRRVRAWWLNNDGPRHAAVVFKKGLGGHYLQKHQAAFIVSCSEILSSKEN